MCNKMLALLMLFAGVVTAQTLAGYRVQARYPVPGTGGWDYVTLDSSARRLYLSHATQVEVVDADNGKLVGTITDTPGVHGVALVPAVKRGYTSNGRENKVSVFDMDTLQVIKKIDVGKGPDGIYFDKGSKRIFTCNHGSDDITALDAETGAVVGTVPVGGGGEQMATGRDGMIYVNVEDTAEVLVFDPRSLAVKHRFPIGVAKVPTGLAYDAKTNRLFIGCREKPTMVVMDAANGKVISSFPIGGGVDWASFDPEAKMVFTSNGEGTLSMFQQKSADVYEDIGALKTQQSAKTMAFDPQTKKIFLPAGEFVTTPATDPAKKAQRSLKPGSFVVLVVGKS